MSEGFPSEDMLIVNGVAWEKFYLGPTVGAKCSSKKWLDTPKVLALPVLDQRELHRTILLQDIWGFESCDAEASLKIWMDVLLIPLLGAPFIVFLLHFIEGMP